MNAPGRSVRTVAILLGLAWPVVAIAQDEAKADAVDNEQQASKSLEESVDLDTILNSPLSESDYREQRMCLPTRSVHDVEVLDDTLVLFESRRGKLWLNQLAKQCYGLDQDMVLRFRVFAGNYCRLDRFRGMPRIGNFALTSDCHLGQFETVADVQVEALRNAIAERRRVSDMAKKTRRAEKRARKRRE